LALKVRVVTKSDHCDGRRFFLPGAPSLPSLRDVIKWQRTRESAPWPKKVEIAPQALPPVPPRALAITWINHASFLLRTAQSTVLIDPVYSEKVGPFGLLGPRRVHPPGIAFDALPKIDAVLVSHDHYDHCDLSTLKRLVDRDHPCAIVPLANAGLMRRAGFEKIIELDWWEKHIVGADGEVTLTPAQHWSNRLSGTRCGRVWGGFFLRLGPRTLHFVGDSGFHPTLFRDIRERLGPPDVALIPIGAYEPRWFMRNQHCNPAEAVAIHHQLDAGMSIGMHWGTFQLTDEAREAPVEALKTALSAEPAEAPIDFIVLQPGQTQIV
jgi:L-ascorbate metabolism protein UlaG (beta-lactamase superfamily)